MENELAIAKSLALEAGSLLMQYYRQQFVVEWKSPGDPVTVADRLANQLIVDRLAREFPRHAILSEEAPDDFSRLNESHVWIIDPLDGTREFIANRDEFAVQIGLIVDGTPVLGVVYQPASQKLYYAATRMGAFLEAGGPPVQLHVSREQSATQMTMAVSRSNRPTRVEAIRQQLHIPNAVQLGSVGLKVGLICEGRAHLYVHMGSRTQLWDTCGPEAILREAGGRMTDISNEPLRYTARDVRNANGLIASNGTIHERAVQVTQTVAASFR